MDDITLTEEWTPIGGNRYDNQFNGKYEGNDKTISNIIINNYTAYTGLFGDIYGGSISNLTLRDANIDGGYRDYTGVLCGLLDNSSVENIKIEGNINLSSTGRYVGALTGQTNSCIIREVLVTGNINVSSVSDYDEGNYIGGLIGWNGGSDVTYCCVDSLEGSVKGNNYVGGLFGYSSGGETNTNSCYSRINVEANGQYVGGFAGSYEGPLMENCYSDCQITIKEGDNEYYGGLVGDLRSYVYLYNCYASGSLLLNSSNANYVGAVSGTIDNQNQSNNLFSTVKITVGESYTYNGNSTCYNPASAETPLWYRNNKYEYDDDTDETHYGRGYDTSYGWNGGYWYDLTEGGFPKLIGLPNR